jgi:hypothetical protein
VETFKRQLRALTLAPSSARFLSTRSVCSKGKGVTMEADSNEAIELCRRVITSPCHQRNPRWGEDFIAHRIAEHPEIEPEVRRIRQESEPRLPHV